MSLTMKMPCLFLTIMMAWLCGNFVIAMPVEESNLTPAERSSAGAVVPYEHGASAFDNVQAPGNIVVGSTLPDRAVLAMKYKSYQEGLLSNTRELYIINEYKGSQIVRQSLCDPKRWYKFGLEEIRCQSSPELGIYEEPLTLEKVDQAWHDYQTVRRVYGSTLVDTFVIEDLFNNEVKVKSNGVSSERIPTRLGQEITLEERPFLPGGKAFVQLWGPQTYTSPPTGELINPSSIEPYEPWSEESYLPKTGSTV